MIDKKEIKKAYKQTIQPMGIYQVKNKVNGKIFIGCSKNFKAKFNSIQFQLNNGSYINKTLQDDFIKYGMDNFAFEVLDYLEPKEDPAYDYTNDLIVLEDLWLDKLQPFGEKGYNSLKVMKK
jgi:group I intron endonuclease